MANFSIREQLPIEGPSAFCGQPPNTQADLHIIRGYFRIFDVPETVSPSMVWQSAPPRYVHDDKQAGIIVAMTISMVAILGITVARILARIFGKNTVFGLDDYAVIPAAALALVYPTLQILAVIKGGGGRHSWENTYENLQNFYYYLDTCTKLYYADVALAKISIALFVRRLANRAALGWCVATDVFLGTVVVHLVASVLVNCLRCDPARAAWDMEFGGSLETAARCHSFYTVFRSLHTVHVAQSMMLLMAPVVILWKVQMNTAKKCRLFVIWVAGALSVLGGLLQMLLKPTMNEDVFMAYTVTLQWTMLDLSMGVVAASLPVLDSVLIGGWRRAAFRIARLRGKYSSSNLRTGDPGNSSSTSGAHSQSRAIIGGGGGDRGGDSSSALALSRPGLSSGRDHQSEIIEATLPLTDDSGLRTEKEYVSYEMPNFSPRGTVDTGAQLGESSRQTKTEV
ncbi:hypothetical protein MCOR27_002264 [Pyricularia oryzae]|uniref:Rhodopsin domain-containing protein n=2 Tax=Pyricularia TaxID=48558 RepID=A0ABQ8NJC0_PYRGI|nr:hypothetical protein MCOR02_004439 [Pyricularia oryzae]KAI6297476.1 hypothetical protein MCOR33_006207 [Pyricularia grisea]KAI6258404.1 hypothetical protein MCOR19_005208 [Pyricularia oryzae]KAI6285604.1 hypothetical protein MCOR27_002264 [Pyricularia oryzae]KAI6321852.1 hypothetical protein MCOR34_002437 [Pyricularia oryzae]